MKSAAIEYLGGHVDIAIYGVASVVISFLGMGIEGAGIGNLIAGDLTLGLWEVFMGAVAMYVGFYLLGYRELLPRVLATG